MKCKICKKEKYLSIFSTMHSNLVVDIAYLYSICYDCYCLVPKYIPRRQVEKWLLSKKCNEM